MSSDSERPTSVVGDIRCQQELEPAGERRRRSRVPVRHAGRERVEQNISGARRGGAGSRRPRGLGDRSRAARDFEVSDHRASERLEVRLARQLGIKRLEASRRARQQAPGVVAALLFQRDSAPQKLGLRAPELVQRPGFDRYQEPERGVEGARVALRGGGRKQALSAAIRVARQQRRSLVKRRGGGQSAPRLRAAGRPLEFSGDVLVRSGCRLGQVPRAPVGINPRVGRLSQRPVH